MGLGGSGAGSEGDPGGSKWPGAGQVGGPEFDPTLPPGGVADSDVFIGFV